MPVLFVFSCGRRKGRFLAELDSFSKETSLESLLWDTKWGSCFILDAKDTCQTPAQVGTADCPSVLLYFCGFQDHRSKAIMLRQQHSTRWRPGSYRGRHSLLRVLASTQTLLCTPINWLGKNWLQAAALRPPLPQQTNQSLGFPFHPQVWLWCPSSGRKCLLSADLC